MPSVDFGVHYSCQSPEENWESVYQDTVEQARMAERLGFETFSVSEHHFLPDGWVPTPEILLGAIAGVTDAARIGTNVTLLPLQNPIQVAERAAVLDVLTSGRMRLGVSIGWRDPEFAGFGIDRAERVPRLLEGLDLVKRLLRERSVTFDGEFYSVADVTVTPRPVQDSVPIWYGGMAEPAIERAARVADSWSVSPFETPAELAECLDVYKSALAEVGRSYEDVYLPLRREVYLADDENTAWAEAGDALVREHGEVYADISEDLTPNLVERDDAVEQLREHASDRILIGSPEQVVEQLEAFHDVSSMDEVLIRTHFPGLDMDKADRSLELFADEVMPHFR